MALTFAEILEASTERCRLMETPLSERLQAFAEEVSALSPEFAAIVERMLDRLRKSGAGESSPQIGETMPDFLLPDDEGRLRSLGEFLQAGPLVIAFHRGHWCPYCRINASTLEKIHGEARALGGQLIAITPEIQRFNNKLKEAAGATFPILTDLDNAFALEIKLTIWVGEEKKTAMKAAGWDISEYNANKTWMLPIPATFIVGPDAVIEARFVDPDYRKRMAVEDILAALGSLQ
jgi:peroxiredoxin